MTAGEVERATRGIPAGSLDGKVLTLDDRPRWAALGARGALLGYLRAADERCAVLVAYHRYGRQLCRVIGEG